MTFRICAIAILLWNGVDASVFTRSGKHEPALDVSKTAVIASRVPCDGYTASADEVVMEPAFSPEGMERSFVVKEFRKEACKVDAGFKCLRTEPEGWKDQWITDSLQSPHKSGFSIHSCYTWGSSDPAQYVVSGWYREGGGKAKEPWTQAAIKQVSTVPEVFEFTDPKGGTARLELRRR